MPVLVELYVCLALCLCLSNSMSVRIHVKMMHTQQRIVLMDSIPEVTIPCDHDVSGSVVLVRVVGRRARRTHVQVVVRVRGYFRGGVKEHESAHELGVVGQVPGLQYDGVHTGPRQAVVLGSVVARHHLQQHVPSTDHDCSQHWPQHVPSTDRNCKHWTQHVASTDTNCKHWPHHMPSTDPNCKHWTQHVSSTDPN